MRYFSTALMATVISFAGLQMADAQQNTNTNTNNNANTTNAAGNVSGQTGQSENFTIQRDANSFIGGAATNFLGGQTASGLGGLGGGGFGGGGLGALGGLGRGNTGFGSQLNSQSTTQPQIRFRITLGFSHPRPAGTKISAQFARRLTRIPQLPSARSVAVTMEDRTAVLAGEVATEHEKMLIEKLAMMEPGVAEVRNELTVTASLELLPLPEATN